MRADRLVALLLHVQRHGGATAPELADLLEVSVRTIYRDVAALQMAGVPLWTQPGPGGGVRLVDGWQVPVAGLTGDEAGALFLTGVPGVAAELGLGAVMATARTKVMAALPPELRARAARVRERFHLDAPGWFQRAEETPYLAVVAEAVWQERRLDLLYGVGPEPRPRRVEPLGLVLKAGTWYVVAAHRRRILSYRLGRVVSAELTDERFVRPEGFDLGRWWAESSRHFGRQLLRLAVTMRLGPRAWELAPHLLVGTFFDEVAEHADPPDDRGWRTIRLPMESEAVATEQLTGLGEQVEVLEPMSLRRALHRTGLGLAGANAPVG